MKFSRQEYWSGLPLPSPGDLPTQGSNLGLTLQMADSLLSEQLGKQLEVGLKSRSCDPKVCMPFSTTLHHHTSWKHKEYTQRWMDERGRVLGSLGTDSQEGSPLRRQERTGSMMEQELTGCCFFLCVCLISDALFQHIKSHLLVPDRNINE